MKETMKTIFFGLLLISNLAFSQKKCNLTEEYAAIFKQKKEIFRNKPFLYETVNKLDSTSACSRFVNENKTYIQYLLDNFSDLNKRKEKLIKIKDTVKLQNEFIRLLKQDSIFNQVMSKLSKAVNNEQDRDTITFDKLLDISVKFFSIYKIKEENYYAKICSGLNGIKQTEKNRLPFVEAFAFSVIFDHYRSQEFNMYNELVKGLRELNKLELGIEEKERLLRAQGAMYMFMKNNKVLKELLISEYKKEERNLLFYIKTNPE